MVSVPAYVSVIFGDACLKVIHARYEDGSVPSVDLTRLFFNPTFQTFRGVLTPLPHKMAEEQPPNVQEGADQPDVLPANAEDRKAAQAMSSLDARGDDETSAPKKNVDMKALGEAMKHLGAGQEQKKQETAKKEEVEKKKVVKADQADVTLLVCQGTSREVGRTDVALSRPSNWTCPRLRLPICYEHTTPTW